LVDGASSSGALTGIVPPSGSPAWASQQVLHVERLGPRRQRSDSPFSVPAVGAFTTTGRLPDFDPGLPRFPAKNRTSWIRPAKARGRRKITENPAKNGLFGGISTSIWEQEVASSNLAAPTLFSFGPFGENVEGLSLCGVKVYVARSRVQTNAIEDLAPEGVV
jgi:hypothetical protein